MLFHPNSISIDSGQGVLCLLKMNYIFLFVIISTCCYWQLDARSQRSSSGNYIYIKIYFFNRTFFKELSNRGKSKNESSKKIKTNSAKKSKFSYDDDDDFDSKIRPSKRSKQDTFSRRDRSSKSKSKRMEVIPWSNVQKGPSIRERLEEIAKQGQSVYKDVYRRAKVHLIHTLFL